MDPDQVMRDETGVMRCRQCGFRYNLSPREVVQRARDGIDMVRAAAQSIPSDRRGLRPEPGIWSVNGYLAHLADAATVIGERIRAIAETHRPPLPYYDQDQAAVDRDYDGRPAEESLARMAAAAGSAAQCLAMLPPGAWQRTGVHERAGEVQLAEIAHDLPHELEHHAEDIRQIADRLKRVAPDAGGSVPGASL